MRADIPPIRTESRDLAYQWLSPLYHRIAAQVPASVTPNFLTALGFGCAVAVAALLIGWRSPHACVVAAVFGLLSGMFDCIDGIHARDTGQTTSFGAYLDAAADAVMAGMIYPALIIRYQLYAPIFIFTACFRPVVACLIHACTAETRVRIDPEFGSVSENMTIAAVLFAAWAFPASVELIAWSPPNSWLTSVLIAQKLEDLTIVKVALLFAAIALPITAIRSLIQTRSMLLSMDAAARRNASDRCCSPEPASHP
jgi:phosphatidylglycerophosphate synthase